MMIVKDIREDDLINYKRPSMVISTARCSLKCDELNGKQVCHNCALIRMPDIDISNKDLIKRYQNSRFSEALVFSGLEPLDQFAEVISLIKDFRKVSLDTIVIYTGYTEDEVKLMGCWEMLAQFPNIIIKVGRFVMNCESHEDPLLGVILASPNQYAVRIS